MLYYLSLHAKDWSSLHLGFLRLFQYVTFRAGGAAFTAFIIVLVLGPFTVRFLKRWLGKPVIRDEDKKPEAAVPAGTPSAPGVVPTIASKSDTPIMGGLLILFGLTVSMLLWTKILTHTAQIFLGLVLGMGLIGFVDDYLKIKRQSKDGLSGKAKLLAQIVVAGLAVFLLDWAQTPYPNQHYVRMLMVPFFKEAIINPLPLWIAVAFGALVVVSASNAVNLSDGMDGLATGCTIVSSIAYGVFAYICGHRVFAEHLQVPFLPGSSEAMVIAAAIVGACLGFLWHNCYPASMFMGDVGSLSLGGAIGLIAVLVKQELLLLVIGGVFVIEAGSVILQVGYYKLTRALTGTPKRLFSCAPIHIHYRKKGLSETQIVIRFWILALLLAGAGLATLKIR